MYTQLDHAYVAIFPSTVKIAGGDKNSLMRINLRGCRIRIIKIYIKYCKNSSLSLKVQVLKLILFENKHCHSVATNACHYSANGVGELSDKHALTTLCQSFFHFHTLFVYFAR